MTDALDARIRRVCAEMMRAKIAKLASAAHALRHDYPDHSGLVWDNLDEALAETEDKP